MSETLGLLLDAAERSIRLRGYHAVSFRELAEELGVKSSSVHYYFRQKEDLGLALVERYSVGFFNALEAESAAAKSPKEKLKAFCSVYRQALNESDRICLCGMLGAESRGLPPALSKAVAEFLNANIDWLAETYPSDMSVSDRRAKAAHVVASLQGAMVLSSSLGDPRLFDDTMNSLISRA